MEALLSYAPPHPGLLPKWMLLVSLISALNTFQTFVTLDPSRRIYNKGTALVNRLQARTFGIWTLTSALIRLYAAYHISNPEVYQLAFGSYCLALTHFGLEMFVFRTAGIGPGTLSPLIVATSSLVWMTKQWDFYVKA